MWTVQQGGGDCAAEEYAVINDEDQSVDGCFVTEEEAQARADTLNGSSDEGDASAGWHAWALPLDTWSTDGRQFAAAGAGMRALPLPLRVITEDHQWGHEGAQTCGSIEELEVVDGVVFARGTFDLSVEPGQVAQRMVRNQTLRWVSADLETSEEEYVEVLSDGSEHPIPDPYDFVPHEDIAEVRWRALSWNLCGLTILDMPAFPQAVIAPADVDLPSASVAGNEAAVGMGIPDGPGPSEQAAIIASAADIPNEPPATWFENPNLQAETPLTVTADGRVFGHCAPWDQCHVGNEAVCVTAPTSPSGYAYFRTGCVRTSDGAEVPTGVITMGGDHADTNLGHNAASAHYADVTMAIADVACGEDEHGIWVAGALRPGITDAQVRALRGSVLSGDWRRIGGSLEMIAALAVNAGGFPVMRTFAASGVQQTLVASVGSRRLAAQKNPLQVALAQLKARVDVIDARTRPLRAIAASAAAERVKG